MRQQMSQLKEFLDGSSGDAITTPNIVATTATILSGASVTGTATFNSSVVMGANNLEEPTLLNYCVKGSALGTVGTLATVDMENGNFFSATLGSATTFAFSNPCTTGNFGGFIMELTNGGSANVTWPTSVDFPAGTAPTLTASGTDLLVFVTRDAGTTYHGMVASADSKTPA